MKNSFALARKDFASFFHSWVGVLVFTLFFLITGIFFSLLLLSYSRLSLEAVKDTQANMQGLGLTRFVFGSFFINVGSILMFFIPLLTMRTFAEERRLRTLELLYTYPFSDFEIVWGKFWGLVWFFEALLLPSLVYVPLVHWLGGPLDWGPILMGYLGLWLLGNAYLSLGIFISSVSENQMVSAVLTFCVLLIFWIMDWAAGFADGPLAHVFTALSPLHHYQEFSVGVLDLSNVVYFCFFQFYFLFLTLRSIETRNWKG